MTDLSSSGVSYTSECFHCKPGTYSDKPGAARCVPCAANSYSNKGATACQTCDADKYSGVCLCILKAEWAWMLTGSAAAFIVLCVISHAVQQFFFSFGLMVTRCFVLVEYL